MGPLGPPRLGPLDVAAPRRVWWGLGDFWLVLISGYVLGQIAVAMYLVVSGGIDADGKIEPSHELWATFVVLVAQGLLWIGAAAVVARWKGRGALGLDFGRLRPRRGDWPWLGVGVGIQLAVIVAFVPIGLLRGEDEPIQELVVAIRDGSGIARLLVLLAVFTIGPVAEEVVFRGVLLRSLQRRFTAGWAVTVSAVAFALVHVLPALISGEWALLLGLTSWAAVGIVCGVRAVRTGALAQPILVHVGFNLLTVVLLLVGVESA